MKLRSFPPLLVILVGMVVAGVARANGPSTNEVKAAVVKGAAFFHQHAAIHGGYVYRYSADFSLREAEGIPGPDTIWIQPPGTPAVGLAFLDAYAATGDTACLAAAREAARALSRTQLCSGGWFYSGDFDREARGKMLYRRDEEGRQVPGLQPPTGEAGWAAWKAGRYKKSNLTTLDDDVTQAAIRMLVRMDEAAGFKDGEIHEAARYALEALMRVQYPAGGWSASHDTLPQAGASGLLLPVVQASFPQTWSRAWTKNFTGCYVTNDNLHATAMDALLLAWKTYKDPRYLDAAKKAGDFLVRAQLPEPQPGWAQQYDEKMQPVWGRAFECPAVSGRESQGVMWALLRLASETGDKKYLQPIPPAVRYLRRSLLPSGMLARFYEIGSNRPLYFRRGAGGNGHELTYESEGAASNYGWVWEPELDHVQSVWHQVSRGEPVPSLVASRAPLPSPTDAEARLVLQAQNARGGWVETEGERAIMRDAQGRKTSPPGGVVHADTFIKNMDLLCRWLAAKSAS